MNAKLATLPERMFKEEDIKSFTETLLCSHHDPSKVYNLISLMLGELSCHDSIEEIISQSLLTIKSNGKRNIQGEVEEWLSATTGYINVTNCYKELRLLQPQEMSTARTAFKRLCVKGKAEKHASMHGYYRWVCKDEEIIDYENADLNPYGVKFPFSIENYVVVHKGNIVVIAGESNAGKTAFLMNTALMNCNNFKVNYMSSEMQNGSELRVRMDKFIVPLSTWKPIKFQFRTDNFPDKIEPNNLNIIDYLDEGSGNDATQMSSRLRDIANKLKDGVAIVSLQKDPSKIHGYGGSGTLNRARIYMTITNENVLTIVKGKLWADEKVNPNGMSCRFSLAAGCKFKNESGWIKA